MQEESQTSRCVKNVGKKCGRSESCEVFGSLTWAGEVCSTGAREDLCSPAFYLDPREGGRPHHAFVPWVRGAAAQGIVSCLARWTFLPCFVLPG